MSWQKLSKLLCVALIPLAILLLFLARPIQAAGFVSDDDVFSASDLMIGNQQVTTPTTITVEIISSPWVVVDSNGVPGTSDGELPSVYLVAARVVNAGTVAAENLVVTLDYQEVMSWTLLSGEDPVRTVASLGPGETYHAYWFARYPETVASPQNHQYTVSAVADNAALTSTSENIYDPDPSQTVETRSANGTGNQSLLQTDIDVNIGFGFTMTQTFDLGQNPRQIAFNPVGNPSFDPVAFRLLSVEGNIFNTSNQSIYTFTEEVFIENLDNAADYARIVYNFVALVPRNTTVCSYAGIGFQSGPNLNEKYDGSYCSAEQGTEIIVDGDISIDFNKSVNLRQVEQGQILQYTIAYTNTGSRPLNFSWVWDELPANTTLLTDTVSPAGDENNSTTEQVVWNLGTIPPAGAGSSGVLSFSASVDGGGLDIPDGELLINSAYLGINPGVTIPANKLLTDTITTVVQAPVVTISKTAGQDTAEPGGSLTYVISITNTGSATATDIVVVDELPDGLLLDGTPTPNPSSQAGRTLTWLNLADIAGGGGIQEISIPVRVDPNLFETGTVLTNTSTISFNNSAGYSYPPQQASHTLTVVVPAANLELSKIGEDINGAPLVVGDTIRYTLQVTNTGTFTAYNVSITDDLPDQVTCQNVSGGLSCADPLIWDVGDVAPNGGTASLIIDVSINAGSEGQTIINSATVTSSNVVNPPPSPEVCPDGSQPVGDVCPEPETPIGIPNLELAKSGQDLNGAPLVVSDTVRYTLQVTNTGTYTANNVIVTDDLPDQVTCQSVSGGLSCADPLIWDVGDVAPNGGTASLIIDVTINAGSQGQTIINSATVTSSNVVNPPPSPEVCPDGAPPIEGVCDQRPAPAPSPPSNPSIYLPIVIKN